MLSLVVVCCGCCGCYSCCGGFVVGNGCVVVGNSRGVGVVG